MRYGVMLHLLVASIPLAFNNKVVMQLNQAIAAAINAGGTVPACGTAGQRLMSAAGSFDELLTQLNNANLGAQVYDFLRGCVAIPDQACPVHTNPALVNGGCPYL